MSTAIAQNIPVSKPLTLTETIQIAVVENPEVKAARFHVDSMESRANQARSGFFPQIHFSETFNRKNDRCRRSGGTRHLVSDAWKKRCILCFAGTAGKAYSLYSDKTGSKCSDSFTSKTTAERFHRQDRSVGRPEKPVIPGKGSPTRGKRYSVRYVCQGWNPGRWDRNAVDSLNCSGEPGAVDGNLSVRLANR